MTKLFFKTVILCVIILFSCKPTREDTKSFTEQSFRKTYRITDGNRYTNDSLMLGRPMYIQFHPDSFLIIQDRGYPEFLEIIDLKNNKVQKIISPGKGPGELISAKGIQIQGNDLYVFGCQLAKVIKLSPDKNRLFQITGEFNLDERTSPGFYPLSKDLFICFSDIGDDNRLTLLNYKGHIIKKFGDYPQFTGSPEIKGDNDIFGSYIAASPDGEKIVLACAYTDILELYSTEKGLLKRLHGPIGIKLAVSRQNVGTYGWIFRKEPSYITYCKLDANKNEFWVGYVGFKEDRNKRSEISDVYPKTIFCFDWNGKPLRKILFDYPILTFDADWNNKVLYTIIIMDGKPELMSFSLVKIV